MSTRRKKKGKETFFALALRSAWQNWEDAQQWCDPKATVSNQFVYLTRLGHCQALVEAMEEFTCGQIGGYAKGQTKRTLRARIEWLEKHYLERKGITK